MSHNSEKIVVIGAGLAGLTAAYRLHLKGCDVSLYEASSKVGGRVHTVYLKDNAGNYVPIELGGQNLTDGGESQLIIDLVQELGLSIREEYLDHNVLTLHKGVAKDFYSLLKELEWTSEDIDSQLHNATRNASCIDDVLVQLFGESSPIIDLLRTRLVAYEGVDTKLQSITHNIETLRCLLKGHLSTVHDADKIHIMTIEGGNAKLPLKLAEALDSKIHLNSKLSAIEINDDKIDLNFLSGERVQCDKLIFANPASTFKDIIISEELISAEKLEKINSMQYGKNCKVLLPVEAVNVNHRAIVMDSQVSLFDSAKKFMLMYFANSNDLENVDSAVEMLTNAGFIQSDISDAPVKLATDEHYIKYDSAVTKIWSEDKNYYGSYSGYDVFTADAISKTIEINGIKFKELFSPIDDRVFFIGEHTTIIDAVGTMEAAVESAYRLVKYLDVIDL